MKWNGIVADTTDVDETPGVSAYQVNTRMKVDGELQRRHGMIAALPQVAGPILSIAGGNGFIVSAIEGGSVDGTSDPVGVLIGPIIVPPVIQHVPQLGPWRYFNPDNPVFSQSQFFATCGGTITVTCGTVPPGDPFFQQNYVFRAREDTSRLPIDTRVATTGLVYTVTIPPDPNYEYAAVGVSPYTSDGSVTFVGNSTPGCGREWYFNQPVSVNAITIFYVQQNNAWLDTRGALCPGKVRLTFSSVTAAGAFAAAYRSDDTGGVTSIFDNRTIFSGMTYEIDVPSRTAANNLGYIRISIDPNGGTVNGTIVGESLLGCI